MKALPFPSLAGGLLATVLLSPLAAMAGNAAAAGAPAVPPAVETVMTSQAVPRWQQAAREMEAVRKAPPSPALGALWDQLDQMLASGPDVKALGRAASPQSADEASALATWQRWRILAKNADGRYSYGYAYNLGKMRDANGGFDQEAAVFLYHARLALEVDGARCAEGSGYDRIIAAFESQPGFKPVLDKVAALPAQARLSAQLEAIAIERARGPRAPLPWLCLAGSQAMQNAMRRGAQPKAVPAAEAAKYPETIGGKDALRVVETRPEDMALLSAEAWARARQAVLERRTAAALAP